MNTLSKTLLTIEHHALQLPYASLRLPQRRLLTQLTHSIDSHGQLVPVVVVPMQTNQWILIDGYLRINALKRLGKDTLNAQVWDCTQAEALLRLLTEHQSRRFEMIEESLLLRELHTHYELSHATLASRIGRDKSWVTRRLSLVTQLPDSVLTAVSQGKLSHWSATRVLVPVARANAQHGEWLFNYLLANALSTRDLQLFYEHYQRANRKARATMASNPGLFFKAQRCVNAEKQAQILQAGPEGKWNSQLNLLSRAVTELTSLAPRIFYSHQDRDERRELLHTLQTVQTQWDLFTTTMRKLTDAKQRNETDHYQSTSERPQSSHHQSVSETIA